MHIGFTASHSWSKGTHSSGKFVHILFVLFFFPTAERFEVGRHFATTFSHSFISGGMWVFWFLLWITNSLHAFGKANANSAHYKFWSLSCFSVCLCKGWSIISCSVAVQRSKPGALFLLVMLTPWCGLILDHYTEHPLKMPLFLPLGFITNLKSLGIWKSLG